MITDARGRGDGSDARGGGYNLGSCSCRVEPLMQPLIMTCSLASYSAIVLGLIFLISEVGSYDPVLGFVRVADIYVRNLSQG